MERLNKKYTTKELAESFVFRTKITAKEKKEAVLELAEARKKSRERSNPNHVLLAKLLQLKYQIEDYSRSTDFDNNLHFGSFLKEYVRSLNKKNKDLASDLDVDETYFSQIINKHRKPNDELIIRLEIHCNKIIPAITWYKLIEKEKEYELITDTFMRKHEKKHVKNSLNFQSLIKA